MTFGYQTCYWCIRCIHMGNIIPQCTSIALLSLFNEIWGLMSFIGSFVKWNHGVEFQITLLSLSARCCAFVSNSVWIHQPVFRFVVVVVFFVQSSNKNQATRKRNAILKCQIDNFIPCLITCVIRHESQSFRTQDPRSSTGETLQALIHPF